MVSKLITRAFYIFVFCFLMTATVAEAALSIDGPGISNSNAAIGNTLVATITTADTKDQICVISKWVAGPTVTGVTDAPGGLTWARRQGAASTTGSNDYDVEEWCAFSASALPSDTVTVTGSSAPGTPRITVFAVNGVGVGTYPTCYYDPNASIGIPTTKSASTSPIIVITSTTNSHDLLVAYTGSTGSGYTMPSGFSSLISGGTGGNNSAAYEVVSSTLSSVGISFSYTTGGGGQVELVDAFQDGSTNCAGGGGGFPAPPHHRWIFH